jgi:hypothetical protein
LSARGIGTRLIGMHRCPECQTVVAPGRIQGGVAQCPRCETIFEIDAAEAATGPSPRASRPQQPKKKLQLPIPPTSVVVEPHSHGVEIRIPWKHQVSGWVHLILFGLLVFAVIGVVQGESLLFGVVLFTLALFGWGTMVFNTTTVLVARRGIEISHGPIPTWLPSIQKPSSSLRGLRVNRRMKTYYTRYGGRRTYWVYDLENHGTPLLKNWGEGTSLEYVKECIEAVQQDRDRAAG